MLHVQESVGENFWSRRRADAAKRSSFDHSEVWQVSLLCWKNRCLRLRTQRTKKAAVPVDHFFDEEIGFQAAMRPCRLHCPLQDRIIEGKTPQLQEFDHLRSINSLPYIFCALKVAHSAPKTRSCSQIQTHSHVSRNIIRHPILDTLHQDSRRTIFPGKAKLSRFRPVALRRQSFLKHKKGESCLAAVLFAFQQKDVCKTLLFQSAAPA